MAKSDLKSHQLRMDGMAYALQIAKDKGLEELEKEVKLRQAHFIPLEITEDIVRKGMASVIEEQSSNLQDLLIVIACMALYDEFGFRGKRIQKFAERFNYLTECSMNMDKNNEHYVTVCDFAEYLNETCGSHFDTENIKRIQEIEAMESENN